LEIRWEPFTPTKKPEVISFFGRRRKVLHGIWTEITRRGEASVDFLRWGDWVQKRGRKIPQSESLRGYRQVLINPGEKGEGKTLLSGKFISRLKGKEPNRKIEDFQKSQKRFRQGGKLVLAMTWGRRTRGWKNRSLRCAQNLKKSGILRDGEYKTISEFFHKFDEDSNVSEVKQPKRRKRGCFKRGAQMQIKRPGSKPPLRKLNSPKTRRS